MSEIWKYVIGYEGRYKVSNKGNIESVPRTTKTKKGERHYKGKKITPVLGDVGYLVVNITKSSKTTQMRVHKIVAEAFLGSANGRHVNHKDTNKLNNTIENLEYVSAYENSLHAFKMGCKVGKTILTKEERAEIRALRGNGVKLRIIADKFGVSISAISEIFRGTTWAWE